MRSGLAVILSLFFVMTSCFTIVKPISGGNRTQQSAYKEDLSQHRVSYDVPERVLIDTLVEETGDTEIDSSLYVFPVNDTVNAVLDSIAAYRLKNNRAQGYTILVYSSLSREEARKALGRLYKVAPDTQADLHFQQPFFRVKVGKFTHEYHAFELLNTVTQEFPSAVIIPETYTIKKPDGD